MKVCIFGCGYVGLTAAAALSEIGHDVYCIDTNDYRIKNIQKGILDIYEPNLSEIVLKNIKNNKLRFYVNFEPEKNTDIYMIAVNTPQKENGQAETINVKNAISKILSSITKYTVIVNKSTVPVGCALKLKEEFKKTTSIDFDIVSNPEFLSQGSALKNFLHPQRIIVGTSSKKAYEKIKELYKPLKSKIITMDENSAELTKYAANSFLAVKISYINEIANLASATNANISMVKKGLASDIRIGKHFLNSGIGYGGSCLPKDTSEIVNLADKLKVDLNIIKAARSVNENQKRRFIAQILRYYNYNIENKVFCIWGLSFKPNTSDLREAPSKTVIDTLIRYGANVRAHDPQAKTDGISQFKTKEEALMDSDALIIMTEWDEYKKPDFNLVKKYLSDKVIFDARNIYSSNTLKKYGLKYYYIGKPHE